MKLKLSFLMLVKNSDKLNGTNNGNEPNGPNDICGDDNRTRSYEDAVCRIITQPIGQFGTGFILFNGKIATAGHVVVGINDESIIEFNVPLSQNDGTMNHASANDQYHINVSSITSNTAHNNGEGDDWAVFSVSPNSNTGLMPKEAQNSFFYVEQNNSFDNVRVTGYGQADGSLNHVQQSSSGINKGSSGNIVKYDADTKADNSGSPVINQANGYVIGIHTIGHCADGYNAGTSMLNSSLWNVINPVFDLTIHQKFEDGSEMTDTYIDRWSGTHSSGSFENNTILSTGAPIDNLIYGSYETFRGKQDLYSTTTEPNEKYNTWKLNQTNDPDVTNHQSFLMSYDLTSMTSQFKQVYSGVTFKNEFLEVPDFNPTNDVVEFKDPWLIDYNDPDYNGTTYRNRGMSGAIFKSRSAPFSPDYNTYYGSDQYLGIFLNQEYDPQGDNPYYSLRSPIQQPQSIYVSQAAGYHKFYFCNWSSTGTDPLVQNNIVNGYYESPVVFRSGSATVTANLKGQGFSDNQNAYKNNNQRRIVRSSNGNLHMVYESMNHVWYERKTPQGNWELMNGGKPLDRGNGAAWNPSIDFSPEGSNDVVIITFVEERLISPYGYNIMVQVYSQGNYQYQESALAENFLISSESTPVIALGHQTFVVGWTHGSNLFYRLGQIGSQVYWDDDEVRFIDIGGDAEKSHPTIGTDHNYVGQLDKYRLAWDQNGRIWVAHLEVTLSKGMYPYDIGVTEGYSFSQAGFTSNYEPSISVMPNSDYRLSWIGENNFTKSGQLPERKVVTWFNNQFYIFGTSVTSHSTSATSDGRDIISYGDYNGGQNKFAHIWYYTYYQPLNTTGTQTHLSNGSSLNDMYAMSFQNITSPFSFSMSQNLGSLSKINNANISSGREALVTGDSTQFYFILGDVTVDDNIVNYIETSLNPDFSSIDTLNYYLKTEPFTLRNSSQFSFSIQYGVTDSLKAASEFSENEYIKFKLQLVNATNGQLIGEYTVVTFNQANIISNFSETFSVNTNGIGNKNVILKIMTEDNINGTYDIANINADDRILPKKNVKEITYSNEDIIAEYALEQNFPNPFNPATTINYQIPQTGFVTLKIYDILGKEVATLVNEQKNQGRYSVNFDASKLASGVYIYHIRANDYVSSKKMLLLK